MDISWCWKSLSCFLQVRELGATLNRDDTAFPALGTTLSLLTYSR